MPDRDEGDRPRIGWTRAILTAAVIAVVGIAVLVYGANAILTKVHGLNRGNRVGIATAMFFVVLVALGGILRLLQRWHWI